MTRQELHDMITDEMYRSSSANKLADRILAALESEREGEVVLWEGVCKTAYRESENPLVIRWGIEDDGKRGQLIFREEVK